MHTSHSKEHIQMELLKWNSKWKTGKDVDLMSLTFTSFSGSIIIPPTPRRKITVVLRKCMFSKGYYPVKLGWGVFLQPGLRWWRILVYAKLKRRNELHEDQQLISNSKPEKCDKQADFPHFLFPGRICKNKLENSGTLSIWQYISDCGSFSEVAWPAALPHADSTAATLEAWGGGRSAPYQIRGIGSRLCGLLCRYRIWLYGQILNPPMSCPQPPGNPHPETGQSLLHADQVPLLQERFPIGALKPAYL